MNRVLLFLLIAVSVFLLPYSAFSHGGGLNGCGGHNDRKRGTYHIHRMWLHCNCHPTSNECSTSKPIPEKKRPQKRASRNQLVESKKPSKVIMVSSEPRSIRSYIVENYDYKTAKLYATGGKSGAIGLQVRLKELGYYDGKIDGKLGRNSLKSLYAFQRDHGFEKNHQVTLVLFEKIDNTWEKKVSDESTQSIKSVTSQETRVVVPSSQSLVTSLDTHDRRNGYEDNKEADDGVSFFQILIGLFIGYLLFGRKFKR